MFHLSTVKEETYRLLQSLFLIETINKQFVLAGGTALALQLGHRHSIDLDIFSPNEFNTREIEITLSSVPEFDFKLVNANKQMLFAYINQIKYDSSQLYFLWRSITYFEDAEEDVDIEGYAPYTKNWQEIKSFIFKNCR